VFAKLIKPSPATLGGTDSITCLSQPPVVNVERTVMCVLRTTMSRHDAKDLIEELRVLFAKGDEEGFNELLNKIAREYNVSIDELLLHL